MTTLLLAEELFLLTHDDESGKVSGAIAPDNGLAAALLLDLADGGWVRAEGEDGEALVAADGTPEYPLLRAAQAAIRDEEKPRKAAHWVRVLPGKLKPLGEQVGRSLAERGVLAEERKKALGLFPVTTWPEVDPAPERALRERLEAVLVQGEEPRSREALLVSLLASLELAGKVVAKEHAKAAKARAKAIAESNEASAAASAAVEASVRAVQVAVMTAVIVPVIVAGS